MQRRITVRVYVASIAVVTLFFATAAAGLAMQTQLAMDKASIATDAFRQCSTDLAFATGKVDGWKEVLGINDQRREALKASLHMGRGGGQ